MEPLIRVENLTHTYGEGTPFCRSAIKNMNLTIYEKEILGVIGHTGSGKSTLMQHLNGLLKPSGGTISFQGKDIWADPKSIREIRFQIGLVFQYPEYQLFEETVEKDIAFGPKNMGLSGDALAERVEEAAGFVGLSKELLKKSPFELSGGQKRRVAIAGVIAMMPKVLILDEPSAGLDPAGRDSLMEKIRSYHHATGATIVIVSHSMDEIAENADRIAVLCGGSVLHCGTPHEVFAHGEELESVGLSVPQVTKIAMELHRRGVPIDPAVYTLKDMERELARVRKEVKGC